MKKKTLHTHKLTLQKSIIGTLTPDSMAFIKGGGETIKGTKGTSGLDCDGQSTVKCKIRPDNETRLLDTALFDGVDTLLF